MPRLPHVPKVLLPSAHANKRIITDFAERAGMVYFGYVSQRSDDHHIVRGLTVSNKHVDDHYCIGTYEGYDIVFVERSDSLRSRKHHVWHILEFDLKTTADIPHIFIGSATRGYGFHELLETKYPTMLATSLGNTAEYPADFTSHFSLYVTPTHAIDAEAVIPLDVAATIGGHFKGLVMEIADHSLYIYSERSHLSSELLDTMLRNGHWLAEAIDKNNR